MIRSLSPQPKKVPIPTPLDLTSLFIQYKELEKLRDITKQKHDELTSQTNAFVTKATQKLAYLDALIEEVKFTSKGDKGDKPVAGVDYPVPKDGESVSHEKVVEDVLKKIPPPKDGISPTINEDALVKKVAKLIKIPIPKNGKDATPLDPKAVVELIKKEKLLKIEHVVGLREEVDGYRSRLAGKHYGEDTTIRGGGDTVAAGSGVTITNNNGVKTISSSGGAGLTALSATETPNSTLTVFTFSAATAQPSYLIVDNVWQKAVTKSGTVNWTWNAGAKQATLAIPPADDIWGVV